MNSFVKFIIAGAVSLPILFSATEVHAAVGNNIETPMAGIAVALDKFYANYEDPSVELRAYSVPDSRTASVIISEQLLDTNALLAKVEIEEIAEAIAVSPYANVAIAKVDNYVNIRSEASTDDEIVGEVYNNAAATILSTVEGEDGDWYEIKSGSVHGYIKSEYFVTGTEAERIAKEVGDVVATVVGTPTLRLRKEAAESLKKFEEKDTLTLLAEGSEYAVLEETEDGLFVKIQVDTDLIGYVSAEFVEVNVEFKKAISMEEKKKAEEEAENRRRAAEAAIARAEEAKKKEKARQAAGSAANTNRNNTNTSQTNVNTPPAVITGGSEVSSATRDAIIAYAKQFLGNPYVYGGTSLTNGADCSGFTSSVYANFGISTGRSSRDQAVRGRDIAIADVRPADLILYASGGTINHVAMYIGNGQVIHASTERTGIIISNAYYRTPYKAVTFLD